MKAVDLLTGRHDDLCPNAQSHSSPCTCRLAERQQAARDIDARTVALADAVSRYAVHRASCRCWREGASVDQCDCGLYAIEVTYG